ITVTIMATEPGTAVVTQYETASTPSSSITLVGEKPGSAFRFDNGPISFMGSAMTGYLYLEGEQFVCRFPGEPGSEPSDTRELFLPTVMADGEGVLVRRYDTGVDEVLPFGLPSLDITSYLRRFLGDPGPLSNGDECGAGPMQFRSFGPLQVNFQDDRFVGWSIGTDKRGRSAVDVSLRNGARPGDPANLVTDHFERIEGSTLGAEYYADGVNAIIDEETGLIELLMGGTNCVFR
ncbi:MAG: hypothetical protein AAFQ13_11870, partial [Pseudomonadota bacterium]